MTQCEMIVEYIDKYGSITSNEAEDMFGIKRLASRISDLKRMGVPIDSKLETGKNRFGKPTHYSRYWIIGGKYENAEDNSTADSLADNQF